MEDALFHLQLKQEYEHRMWEQYIQQKEEEEKAYDQMAEKHFSDLELYETLTLEKEYKKIKEWELLTTI
jgi:hypothetical protein